MSRNKRNSGKLANVDARPEKRNNVSWVSRVLDRTQRCNTGLPWDYQHTRLSELVIARAVREVNGTEDCGDVRDAGCF